MGDILSLIITIVVVLNILGLAIIGFFIRKLWKHRDKELTPPHENYNKPAGVELPDMHNWPNHPIEITTDTGTYLRWICENCDSFVQKRKVE